MKIYTYFLLISEFKILNGFFVFQISKKLQFSFDTLFFEDSSQYEVKSRQSQISVQCDVYLFKR